MLRHSWQKAFWRRSVLLLLIPLSPSFFELSRLRGWSLLQMRLPYFSFFPIRFVMHYLRFVWRLRCSHGIFCFRWSPVGMIAIQEPGLSVRFSAFNEVFLGECCRLHTLHNRCGFFNQSFLFRFRKDFHDPTQLIFKAICSVAAISSVPVSGIPALWYYCMYLIRYFIPCSFAEHSGKRHIFVLRPDVAK